MSRPWPVLVALGASVWIIWFGRVGWEGWVSILLAASAGLASILYVIHSYRHYPWEPEGWTRREDWE